MSWIGKIFGKTDEGRGRSVKFYNYDTAESLAIIFKLESEDQLKLIRQYLKFVKDEHSIKKVMAFAYVDQKEAPNYVQSRIDFEFFTRKDCNWQQKPAGISVNNFTTEPFDIIIDLSEGGVIPLKHILVNSFSKFRIGRHSEKNESLYDFMLEVKGAFNTKEFLEQVNHYLTLIKSQQ